MIDLGYADTACLVFGWGVLTAGLVFLAAWAWLAVLDYLLRLLKIHKLLWQFVYERARREHWENIRRMETDG